MTASLGLSRRRMTPSPRTVSSSRSREWIPITTQFATGGRWFPPAAANPTRSGPTSRSSVPTGVSSVTISSSISLRRRAEPETGQPGSRICESSRPYTRPNRPNRERRSSSPADSLPDDNAPVGLLLPVGERSRAGAATSRLLGRHTSSEQLRVSTPLPQPVALKRPWAPPYPRLARLSRPPPGSASALAKVALGGLRSVAVADLPDVGAFGAVFEEFMHAMTLGAVHGESEVAVRLREHLRSDPDELPTTGAEFSLAEQANLQLALDAVLGDAEVLGFTVRHMGFGSIGLSEIPAGRGMTGPISFGPVQYADVEVGDGRVIQCVVQRRVLGRPRRGTCRSGAVPCPAITRCSRRR